MENSMVGVFGASGFGREVMPLVRQQHSGINAHFVFVDDNPPSVELNGHPVLTYQQFLKEHSGKKFITIAIADSGVRKMLTDRCVSDGVLIFDVAANNAVLMDAVNIGEGFIISPFVTITSNVKIGKGFHANIYSYVAHDCVVGDFVTFAPYVKCNGNVVIEDHAYIGTGAILKQGRPGKPLVIGKAAVVGMGAVVTKDVPPGVTVVGNPAKPLIR
ncbi:MAG: acetyltransferase [Saccharospirillaceae bacterium]|nr:acetyltransferase [Saccharospirillaceae bacterium]MCD8531361.1 acetyltransferase [Saccharospirillaceae bacterium]